MKYWEVCSDRVRKWFFGDNVRIGVRALGLPNRMDALVAFRWRRATDRVIMARALRV